jgi:hypothetical protein
MARHKPADVLGDFAKDVSRSRALADAAQRWIVRADGPRRPRFTVAYRDMLIELAFLHTFLAWETFLEESCVLYLLGRESPRRYVPRRFVSPPTRNQAILLTLPESGRRYVDWDNPEFVRRRAQRFFAHGDPYERVLLAHAHMLSEIQIIRNAIVHRSTSSQERFHNLARQKLGYLPPTFRVGTLLRTTVPGSRIPLSFLDQYVAGLLKAAQAIVP